MDEARRPVFMILRQDCGAVKAAPLSSAQMPSAIEDQHPVAPGDQFLKVGGKIQHHRPRRSRLAQKLVDLFTRANVHAARGVVQQQKVRSDIQPFGQHHLLLVAARQGPGRSINRLRLYADAAGKLGCPLP